MSDKLTIQIVDSYSHQDYRGDVYDVYSPYTCETPLAPGIDPLSEIKFECHFNPDYFENYHVEMKKIELGEEIKKNHRIGYFTGIIVL